MASAGEPHYDRNISGRIRNGVVRAGKNEYQWLGSYIHLLSMYTYIFLMGVLLYFKAVFWVFFFFSPNHGLSQESSQCCNMASLKVRKTVDLK